MENTIAYPFADKNVKPDDFGDFDYEHFLATIEGKLVISHQGDYTFKGLADDEMRVKLDDTLLFH
jgi:hypothetical protein